MNKTNDGTTPRPWRVHLGRSVMTWVTAESPKGLEGIKGATGEESTEYYGGNMIAESVTPANARLIVRAVNAHDDLLAAAKAALDPDPCHYDHDGDCQAHGITNPCEQKLLRDAIAKAEPAK